MNLRLTLWEPFRVQHFIGCAHLLRRKLFLELGGYLDRFHYYSKEIDFCLNALLRYSVPTGGKAKGGRCKHRYR
jgi:hypothetical protein